MLDDAMNIDARPEADIWYQQVGATSHAASAAMEWLRNRFGKNKISHRPDIPWPAPSPDHFHLHLSSFQPNLIHLVVRRLALIIRIKSLLQQA